jgi:hypothetical protein
MGLAQGVRGRSGQAFTLKELLNLNDIVKTLLSTDFGKITLKRVKPGLAATF